ncbi:hypothetical protein FHL15_006823 [Xylaria flabelliformis]|uniref:Uncharacterized protein n=1 Tax=Xylaria flabelliformis TaxID=2512241 RepID=A0A553HW88_9PEZI|nr:hypothetical protein FHL15_006823 [Xylaria flabelliformis]
MPCRKGMVMTRKAHPKFTDRELGVVYKALSCIKEVDGQGEAVIDFEKLWKCSGYTTFHITKGRWEHIMRKLAENAKTVDTTRAALANNESTDDNMKGDQKGKNKRKTVKFAADTKTGSDNDASSSHPEPKKARTSKKQAGKKRAAKNPAVEETEEEVEARLKEIVEHPDHEGASNIQKTIDNYDIAQQYASHGGFPLSTFQYPHVGQAYGSQTYSNGESSSGLQQHPALAEDSTYFQNAFNEQAQRRFDDLLNGNDMFSDNAQIPAPPPAGFGFGLGVYAEPENDGNPDFIS